MNTKRELDLTWAAGIIEGEGSIRIAHKQYQPGKLTYYLEISVTMTDEECIKEMHSIFNEGWQGTHHKATSQKRQSFMWICTSASAGKIIEIIYPYLRTNRVKEKAKLAIEFQSQKQRGAAKHIIGYSEKQEEYWKKMSALNTRGHKHPDHPNFIPDPDVSHDFISKPF